MGAHTPIRYRANIPTTWVELKIDEGKKTGAPHDRRHRLPHLRLIRHAIGDLECGLPTHGPSRILSEAELKLLFL